MAVKQVELTGVGTIHLYKRRGARHIRLTVTSTGKIRVTMPNWVPYAAGVEFAKQKSDWLSTQARPQSKLRTGLRIGRLHVLSFEAGERLSSRLQGKKIIIRVPSALSPESDEVQKIAWRACVRALRKEAEDELPGRIRRLAAKHGFDFRSVEVKQLKSRWGSCNHRKEIVLNCYLMQLPDHLIDYVLIHELVHTRILAHGPRFWSEMERHIPSLAVVRKEIRNHRPILSGDLIAEF